jgi:hypothetical protein
MSLGGSVLGSGVCCVTSTRACAGALRAVKTGLRRTAAGIAPRMPPDGVAGSGAWLHALRMAFEEPPP